MEQNIQTEISLHANKNSDEYLETLYARLNTFEYKLDEFLKRPNADITEITEITGYITSLKREIAQIEFERRKYHNHNKPSKILFDNQSILSTSSVRRKSPDDLRTNEPRSSERLPQSEENLAKEIATKLRQDLNYDLSKIITSIVQDSISKSAVNNENKDQDQPTSDHDVRQSEGLRK